MTFFEWLEVQWLRWKYRNVPKEELFRNLAAAIRKETADIPADKDVHELAELADKFEKWGRPADD